MEHRLTIMTVQELARYLRVHTMTVYRMIHRGDLPASRVGRGWRFRKDQIDRWLATHEINSHTVSTRSPRPAAPKRRGRSP
jgi:excisionase family DNA binding protein